MLSVAKPQIFIRPSFVETFDSLIPDDFKARVLTDPWEKAPSLPT
jgi:hypothetical protein